MARHSVHQSKQHGRQNKKAYLVYHYQ